MDVRVIIDSQVIKTLEYSKDQCFYKEISQLICISNQLTGFNVSGTVLLDALRNDQGVKMSGKESLRLF